MNVSEATIETATRALQRDGYIVIEGLMSADTCQRAHEEISEILRSASFGHNSFLGHRTRRVFGLLARTRSLDEIVIDPLMLGLLDSVLDQYQLCVSTAIEIHPEEMAQTLHADDGIYPLPTSLGPLTVNSMWALDDFTEENGATRLVPRSHLRPEKRVRDPQNEVVAAMPAGSALIYLGSLWHGGGANRSDQPRLGVVIEYARSWLRPQENLGLIYPPELVRGLPSRLQELLGYNLYEPFLGYVDGKHPRELLA